MEGVERCGHGSKCQAIGAMPSVTVVRTASERVTQTAARASDQFVSINETRSRIPSPSLYAMSEANNKNAPQMINRAFMPVAMTWRRPLVERQATPNLSCRRSRAMASEERH